jgi:hypothetical protein
MATPRHLRAGVAQTIRRIPSLHKRSYPANLICGAIPQPEFELALVFVWQFPSQVGVARQYQLCNARNLFIICCPWRPRWSKSLKMLRVANLPGARIHEGSRAIKVESERLYRAWRMRGPANRSKLVAACDFTFKGSPS